jgi:phosphatidylglycerol:prolipoprotein diacylglycerol transferase
MSVLRATPTSRWVGRRYLFSVGTYRFPSYLAMLYLGIVGGVYVGDVVAAQEGLSPTRFALVTVALLPVALVGARLWFVLQHFDVFRIEPRRIWRRGEGGSALFGGLFLSLAASAPLLAAVGLPFLSYWDGASVAMLVGLVVTKAGCLMNGCCAGRVTARRFGVFLPNARGDWERRIPSQILEAAWSAVVVAVALTSRTSLGFSGAVFAVVAGGYGAGRVLLEPARESARTSRSLRLNMAVSAFLILVGSTALAWRGL